VNASTAIIKIIEEELRIDGDETTEDGLFTSQKVACLGCCSLSPVVMINDETHGKLTPKRVSQLLQEYRLNRKNERCPRKKVPDKFRNNQEKDYENGQSGLGRGASAGAETFGSWEHEIEKQSIQCLQKPGATACATGAVVEVIDEENHSSCTVVTPEKAQRIMTSTCSVTHPSRNGSCSIRGQLKTIPFSTSKADLPKLRHYRSQFTRQYSGWRV
jgi:NADH:ubiquinone oxidoreductase subunit E